MINEICFLLLNVCIGFDSIFVHWEIVYNSEKTFQEHRISQDQNVVWNDSQRLEAVKSLFVLLTSEGKIDALSIWWESLTKSFSLTLFADFRSMGKWRMRKLWRHSRHERKSRQRLRLHKRQLRWDGRVLQAGWQLGLQMAADKQIQTWGVRHFSFWSFTSTDC